MNAHAFLKTIDDTIAAGPYDATWESLGTHPVPSWYRNAKFGIFVHWGVYSVPAFGNEWYPRTMYIPGTKEYEHHRAVYGSHDQFGYADFIPRFTADRFDPAAWAELFCRAGARFVMPVAEHHDGFQMYRSDLSHWNAATMGPCRDILGELKREIEARDMTFAASSHRAENYWFFGGCRTFDSGLPDITFQEPYGYAAPLYPTQESVSGTHEITSAPPSADHLEDWLLRSCELVDRYQPRVVWFDWWIHNVAFKPYLKRFAAYYYNRAHQWDIEVAINYKEDAFAYGTAVFDIERGQHSTIRPRLWQTDTSIAKNSWGYTENNEFKSAAEIVCDMVDIVSKNGCLLLNVGPKADGTITKEETVVLEEIGRWLQTNGEAIYDTTHWVTFGEGPTQVADGSFTDTTREPFTTKDVRFTYRAPHLYAHVLSRPRDGRVSITSLKKRTADRPALMNGVIKNVEVLGHTGPVHYRRTTEALDIEVADGLAGVDFTPGFPVCFKIEIE